jgi:protein-S-isoprenylcysteine O-methyltransferase Ste14
VLEPLLHSRLRKDKMKTELLLFTMMSVNIIIFSLHVILKPKSHGFYRFFGWQCIAWIFANNYKFWFVEPFSIYQIISWILLIYALYLAVFGVILIKIKGKANEKRHDNSLYTFEKTTVLITSGIYQYIRHPLYGSLVFLAWGILLKNSSTPLLVVCVFANIFLFATMLIEEKENIRYFGESYKDYKKRSKMIIPFIL